MHRLYHQSQNVYHRVFPLLEIHSITSLLESQCVLKRTKSVLHNGCKWEHSPRYTEMSLWLFRHQIFVPVLNVSDVPPCGIVGFSEVEILVRFNTLWPSKGYIPTHPGLVDLWAGLVYSIYTNPPGASWFMGWASVFYIYQPTRG